MGKKFATNLLDKKIRIRQNKIVMLAKSSGKKLKTPEEEIKKKTYWDS